MYRRPSKEPHLNRIQVLPQAGPMGQAWAQPTPKKPEEEGDDPRALEDTDEFYRTTKSLLVLFQIMGIMPIERAGLGKTTFSFRSVTTIYAYIIFICETVYVTLVFQERLYLMLQRGKRFDEYIYNFIFLSILVPHFLLPVAAWRNGSEVAKFKNMWTAFQLKFYRVTGSPLELPKLELITWSACFISWGVGIVIMLCEYFLQPDLLFWHVGAYFHITATLNGIISLWFINCTAMGIASRRLLSSLDVSLNMDGTGATLANYRGLWTDLSHLMQQLGKAYSGMYGMYCILILLTTIVATYGCLTEILDSGLSDREIGLFLVAVYCMALLYTFCNEAYGASNSVGLAIQERLLDVNFARASRSKRMEVELFLTAIDKNPPIMNLNGYVDVNRRLITSVISSMVTYLVMLMQFKMTLLRQQYMAAKAHRAA